MKYIAIINTDEPLTEHTIQFIKDTIFCGDEQAPYVFEIEDIKYKAESDHKCHTCKHYTSGEYDGSCDSYICKGYSDWESEVEE